MEILVQNPKNYILWIFLYIEIISNNFKHFEICKVNICNLISNRVLYHENDHEIACDCPTKKTR